MTWCSIMHEYSSSSNSLFLFGSKRKLIIIEDKIEQRLQIGRRQLNEYRGVMRHHVYVQIFLKQLNIFQAIHCGAWGKKIQPSNPMFAHGPPNHLAWEVFYCNNDVLRLESLAFWSLNVPLPQCKLLNCRFVRE